MLGVVVEDWTGKCRFNAKWLGEQDEVTAIFYLHNLHGQPILTTKVVHFRAGGACKDTLPFIVEVTLFTLFAVLLHLLLAPIFIQKDDIVIELWTNKLH